MGRAAPRLLTRSARRMLFAGLAVVLVSILAPLAPLGIPVAQAAPRLDSPALLYVQSPCTPVYASASRQAPLLTQLLGGTDVAVVSSDTSWTHARIWGGLDGYIPSASLGAQPPDHASEGSCRFPGLPDAEQTALPVPSGPGPLVAQAQMNAATLLYAKPDMAAPAVGAVPLAQAVAIDQWAPGPDSQPWYHVVWTGGAGWAPVVDVRLSLPDPATQQVQGAPIWSPVAGKGMWFTNYLPHHSDVAAMMRAAKAAGITHVYAEVAISQYGFYAQNTLDRLLPAAHAAGIKVIAWVYPDLANVGDDIRLSALAATYKAPSGDRPDGLAADIEGVNADGILDSGSVYAYGQVLRGLLGTNALMVAAVFHPMARPSYPYAALAASFNVLAPMNYWHSRSGRTYAPGDVRRFVTTSITTIRAAMAVSGAASQLPIEELGQTYNMFTDDFTAGPDAPSGDEITADMQTAHDLGCIGVSFFEWQTATQPQWAAISQYAW